MKEKGKHILHYGSFPDVKIGDILKLNIDLEHRKFCSRLHSAGHLLDIAMRRAGRTDLQPAKGYHFADGPYVEYIGVVAAEDRQSLAEELTNHCE